MTGEKSVSFTAVDEGGGIAIPPTVLHALGWKAGEALICRVADGHLRLVKVADPDHSPLS